MGFTEKTGLYRSFNRVWHVMVGVASLAVGYFMMRQNDNEVKNGKQRFIFGECLVNSVLFVLAIAVNFGMSIWITFVAGLVLYKNLATHTFGYVQSKLFPFYFLIGAVTGLTMLLIAMYSSRNVTEFTSQQNFVLIATAVIFVANLGNGIFMGPQSTAIMFEKHKMEKETDDKEKLENSFQYKEIKRSFGKAHGISSLLNMFALGAACYILYWIAALLHELS